MSLFKKIREPILIIFFGFCGFVASFHLTLDKLESLKNANFVPSCSVNPLLDCSVVMKSQYAEVFGIPWSLLGIAGYPVMILAALFLLQNNKIHKYLAWLITAGSLFAFSLSTYFMFISAYLIVAFCPWCIVSAVSSTSIFFALIAYNILNDNYGLPPKLNQKLQGYIRGDWHIPFVVIWFLLLIIMIYLPFGLARYEIFIFLK